MFKVIGILVLCLSFVSCSSENESEAKIAPGQPEIVDLDKIKLHIPIRVYTRDGQRISDFGNKRRAPLSSKNLKNKVK